MLLVLWVVYLILVINFSFSTLNHSYERRASSSGVTTPGENASLQVRRRGVRRRNLCPGFGLPVAGSPGTPFFSFFPFFSYLFFSFLAVENGEIQSSCGVGERLSREQLRRRSPSSRSSCLFFFFSILAMENGGIQSSCVVGERRSCCVVGVRSSGKKKTTQPKTTSFWVGVIFFKNQNTPKRRHFGVTVKSEHPKRRRFEVFYFF